MWQRLGVDCYHHSVSVVPWILHSTSNYKPGMLPKVMMLC
jgi:hypothetical protein